ncbi:MAG: hypothetical protein KBT30_02030 [Clostridiales bacterium]|nr:hypothetical protein [Candidatus Apopatousia equi]
MNPNFEYIVAEFKISKKERISNDKLSDKIDLLALAFERTYKANYHQDAMLIEDYSKANKVLTFSIEKEYSKDKVLKTFVNVMERPEFNELKEKLLTNFEFVQQEELTM